MDQLACNFLSPMKFEFVSY